MLTEQGAIVLFACKETSTVKMIWYIAVLVAFFTTGGDAQTFTQIQFNVDGSAAFDRTSTEFQQGFADSYGNMWAGNQWLYNTALNDSCSLFFNLQSDTDGSWYVARYAVFFVESGNRNYEAHINGFSGNASHDAFDYQDSMMFTTWDSDNDLHHGNCAAVEQGGFWFNNCCHACVNSAKPTGGFIWQGLPGGPNLRSTGMLLLC